MAKKTTKLKSEDSVRPMLHFFLTRDYLVVANHGRPFTAEGLRATCRAQASPKPHANNTQIASQKEARLIMEQIWQAWLEEYRKKPDAPARHAEAERDIGEKLFGVILREFIQNAHDANIAKPMGGKAIGLRTILAISDAPRIHSGSISFCFDRHLAQKALQKGLGKINLSDTPLLRLPFPYARSKEPKCIKNLIQKYDTVFVLPFRNKKVRQKFLAQWDKFVDDVTTLLHLPALTSVIWERDDAIGKRKRTWERGEEENSVCTVDEGRLKRPLRIRLRPPPEHAI